MNRILRLLRPEQWLKNAFVFLPIFFNGKLLNSSYWLQTAIAFIAFSMISSAIYCLNDICDIDNDRSHPVKCRRPLASGAVGKTTAIILMAVTAALSLAVISLSDAALTGLIIILSYAIINTAYCLVLKHIAIIDVFCVSFGFVLRLCLGGAVCHIWISPWMICMTFLLSLFLTFAKRRDDLILIRDKISDGRKSVESYNIPFLNQVLGLLGSITVVCYICYTLSADVQARLGSENIYITSLFVILGMLRYLQISIVDEKSGSPTRMLTHDRFIQGSICGWIISFVIILYI